MDPHSEHYIVSHKNGIFTYIDINVNYLKGKLEELLIYNCKNDKSCNHCNSIELKINEDTNSEFIKVLWTRVADLEKEINRLKEIEKNCKCKKE